MLTLKIDDKSNIPVYKQISRHVIRLIKSGRLTGGERLPPERELAQRLNVARGTVKKAYDMLAQQKMIVATRGRGSIVVGGTSSGKEGSGRIALAQEKIGATINELESLDLSYREIADLFSLCLAQREEDVASFRIAAVDCNPEALGIYRQQIAMLTRMSLAQILFADLDAEPEPEKLLSPFDLIITTSNHIEHLRNLVPELAEKCVPVVVSPSSTTLVSLARIPTDHKIGILYQSKRFFEIIQIWLKKSGIVARASGFPFLYASSQELADFISDKNTLVLPPGFTSKFSSSVLPIVASFRQRGGVLLDFAYEIERGSLLHLEDLIKNLINHSRKTL